MTGRLNWEKANKREKSSPAPEQFQPVKTDAAFWRAWKDDPDAMRASGYRVRKTKDGWRAFIELGRQVTT
jgi:hypothetical protein